MQTLKRNTDRQKATKGTLGQQERIIKLEQNTMTNTMWSSKDHRRRNTEAGEKPIGHQNGSTRRGHSKASNALPKQ